MPFLIANRYIEHRSNLCGMVHLLVPTRCIFSSLSPILCEGSPARDASIFSPPYDWEFGGDILLFSGVVFKNCDLFSELQRIWCSKIMQNLCIQWRIVFTECIRKNKLKKSASITFRNYGVWSPSRVRWHYGHGVYSEPSRKTKKEYEAWTAKCNDISALTSVTPRDLP